MNPNMSPLIMGNIIDLYTLTPEDEAYLFALFTNIHNEFDKDPDFSKDSWHRIFANYLRSDTEEFRNLRLIISTKDGRNPLGIVQIFHISTKDGSANSHIHVDAARRLKGVGTEAMELAINYAATHYRLHRIASDTDEDNIAMRKLFEKTGHRLIGIAHETYFRDGVWHNEAMYERIVS